MARLEEAEPQEETMTDEERLEALQVLVDAENAIAPSADDVARLNDSRDRWSPDLRASDAPSDDVADDSV